MRQKAQNIAKMTFTRSLKVTWTDALWLNEDERCSQQFYDKVVYNREYNKKAVLPQGNRAMLQVFFSVEVRQQHSLQV